MSANSAKKLIQGEDARDFYLRHLTGGVNFLLDTLDDYREAVATRGQETRREAELHERIGYSAREIAAMVNCHVETVYASIERNDIPGRKFGREYLIPRWWVDEFLKKPTEEGK